MVPLSTWTVFFRSHSFISTVNSVYKIHHSTIYRTQTSKAPIAMDTSALCQWPCRLPNHQSIVPLIISQHCCTHWPRWLRTWVLAFFYLCVPCHGGFVPEVLKEWDRNFSMVSSWVNAQCHDGFVREVLKDWDRNFSMVSSWVNAQCPHTRTHD